MNTVQNYTGKGFYATTSETDEHERQQMTSYTDEDRGIMKITEKEERRWIGWLWTNGYLSDDDGDWSIAIAVPDSAMSPQLIKSAAAIAVVLDPSEFDSITGVVAVRLKNDPDAYVFGRLDSVSENRIVLSRDNEAFPALIIERVDIRFMYRVVFSVLAPVL